MATLSDLEEVKAALDKGLVSQADYDDVKRDYLRAKKKALEAKEDALEFQKKKLEFQKRELIAKEAFQQRKSEADLRAYALESIVKHGSSIMSEEQKDDLVRDYVKMSGLDRDAKNDEPASKRQKTSSEERSAAPPLATLPAPADAPTPAATNEAPTPAAHSTPRPAAAAAGPSTSGVAIDKQILRLLSMSDEQNAGFVRGCGKMSGLGSSAENHEPAPKRQRSDERDVVPPQPLTPPFGTRPASPDAPTPAVANEAPAPALRRTLPPAAGSAFSDGGVREVKSQENITQAASAGKKASARKKKGLASSSSSSSWSAGSDKSGETKFIGITQYRGKKWEAHVWAKGGTPEGGEKGRQLHLGYFTSPVNAARAYDRAALFLRGPADTRLNFGASVYAEDAIMSQLKQVKREDFLTKLRALSAEEERASTCTTGAMDLGPASAQVNSAKAGWTEEDDNALVAALRAGRKVNTIEIGGRSGKAAYGRLRSARKHGTGSPALREYLKDHPSTLTCCPWSVEEDQTLIQAHKEGKTYREIAALLPGRTKRAVEGRLRDARNARVGTAALLAYAAEFRKG